jgi:hypothetical protein
MKSEFIKIILILSILNFVNGREKPISLSAHIHIFLLKLIGKHDVVEKEVRVQPVIIKENPHYVVPRHYLPREKTSERPKMLTTTTFKPEFSIFMKKIIQHSNGTLTETYEEVKEPLNSAVRKIIDSGNGQSLPEEFIKIYNSPINNNPNDLR